MTHFNVTVTSDGVAEIVLAVQGTSMNVLSPAVVSELSGILDELCPRTDVRGFVITSSKKDFAAGWDLQDLLGMLDAGLNAHQACALSADYPSLLRRLETCGKPVAAAINGLALGGGLELALACHYRVLAASSDPVIGLPEVKVGLLPGAGGTQRLARLVGVAAALPLLLQGESVAPDRARELGIVHEVVAPANLLSAARKWLLSAPTAKAPWDVPGFAVPGGASLTSTVFGNMMAATVGATAKSTLRNYPAPPAILSAVFEGVSLPIDRGLAIERKYFSKLIADRTALGMVRTLFLNRGRADRLARRPADIPRSQVRKLAVLGAGMMGSGIAHVSAAAGMDVVLLDSTLERATQGREQCAATLEKAVAKGRLSSDRAAQILARIQPVAEYSALAECDFVVEAVFEDRAVKNAVIQKVEAVIRPDAIFASNTSTLPITGLAEVSSRPGNFIGVHFFSPVDRMALVEIIVGKTTAQHTLARALDYVGQLRKTPIVVNDSRGFYTSRVFGTYWSEGQRMLEQGVDPALIENAGRFAGMPVGPLAVSDEVSIELQYKALKQGSLDLGSHYELPVSWPVVRHFVEDLKRLGRKSGGGFYDYPPGRHKHLWAGLATEYPRSARQPTLEQAKVRLLHIQALETVRCLEEGVLANAWEADVGSVLGWGFPTYTGGTLSYIDRIGIESFVTQCERLADELGPRFKPSADLINRARSRERFHPQASWQRTRAAS